jgi:hypothetical protein
MYEQVNPNVLIFHRTDWLLAETGLSFILIFDSLTVLRWHTDDLHVAKLPALKQPLVTVSCWPLPVIRPFQKANLNTGHSDF